MSLLHLDRLTLHLGKERILDKVSLEMRAGEVFGLAGESGSGKTMTALSILRLLPRDARLEGDAVLAGESLARKSEAQMCAVRGRDIGMVFQEPMSALNPVQPIGMQVAETVRIHTGASRSEALDAARQTLDRVGLGDVALQRYPHSLSGGQRQRVAIAIAIALRPKVLIADEPTTALDVSAQAQVLEVLQTLVREDGMALMLITHDLAVLAQMADRMAVMRAGRIVESGEAVPVLSTPSHAYTRSLLANTIHRARAKAPACPKRAPVLEARHVSRDYAMGQGAGGRARERLSAVKDVSFTMYAGETLGLAGESGCGKSTLLRTLLALEAPQQGEVLLQGERFAPGACTRAQRRRIQMVFQDPYGSFDPRQRVETLVAEPLVLSPARLSARQRREAVERMLARVGLDPEDADKYPHQFSGGQRQRLAIARALICRPAVVALDEAVSALDVTVRMQILDLLADLSREFSVAFLFVSHDLGVVRAICDRVLVMQAGRIVEEGGTEDVFTRPQHPYTRSLIAAAPDLQAALAMRRAG